MVDETEQGPDLVLNPLPTCPARLLLRRLTRQVVPGLPRPGTFRRQNSERRERLTAMEQCNVGAIQCQVFREETLEPERDIGIQLDLLQGHDKLNEHVQQAEAILMPWRVEKPTEEECSFSEKPVAGSHTSVVTISSDSERELDALANIGRQENYQLDNMSQSSMSPSDQSCAMGLDLKTDFEIDSEPILDLQLETRQTFSDQLLVEARERFLVWGMETLAPAPKRNLVSFSVGKKDGKTLPRTLRQISSNSGYRERHSE